MPGYDQAVCCGDLVGYGREPEYCLDFIVRNKIHAVKGNHDAMVTGECPIPQHPVIRESIEWTKGRLNRKYLDILQGLPESLETDDLYATHTFNDKYIYGEQDVTPDIADRLKTVSRSHIVIGHTHTHYTFIYAGKTIFNPSSITKGRKGCARGYAVYQEAGFEFTPLPKEIL